MKKKGHTPITKVKNPEPNVDDPDWIIWAAWTDRISFEEIEKKTGKTESRSSAESTAGKKTYRRADLIRLKATDPNRYADLSDEIYNAYAEGRVK